MKKVITKLVCICVSAVAVFLGAAYYFSFQRQMRIEGYRDYIYLEKITEEVGTGDKCYFALNENRKKFYIVSVHKNSLFEPVEIKPFTGYNGVRIGKSSKVIFYGVSNRPDLYMDEMLVYYFPEEKITEIYQPPYPGAEYTTEEIGDGTLLFFWETHPVNNISPDGCRLEKIKERHEEPQCIAELFTEGEQ